MKTIRMLLARWKLRRRGFRTVVKWEFGKRLLYVYTSIGIFKDVLVF